MPKLLLAKSDLKRLLRDRRRNRADRLDEVWNGVYVMSPSADNEHNQVSGDLLTALNVLLKPVLRCIVLTVPNVSDDREKWDKNYRIPDIAVFLPGNPAEDRGTHWLGGPDFAVEVVSPNDHSRKKLGFYAKVGVRELMLVNRKPWRLDFYVFRDGELRLAESSNPAASESIPSTVLPIRFRMLPGNPRPQIEVTRTSDGQQWLA